MIFYHGPLDLVHNGIDKFAVIKLSSRVNYCERRCTVSKHRNCTHRTKKDRTWNLSELGLGEVTVTNDHSVIHLPHHHCRVRPVIPRFNHPRVVPSLGSLHSDDLGAEPNQLTESELVGELVQKPKHLLVTWKGSLVLMGALRKWVIEKAHELAGEVGAERVVEAGTDDVAGRVEAERIGVDS